jgi:hypothetical protein
LRNIFNEIGIDTVLYQYLPCKDGAIGIVGVCVGVDIAKNRGRFYYERIPTFLGLYHLGVFESLSAAIDPLPVALAGTFHINNQGITQNTIGVNGRNAQAFFGIFAPLGATNIQLGICDHLFAAGTFHLRIIFPELYRGGTVGATNLKNIFRFPESLVLTGTLSHNSTLNNNISSD